MKNFVCLLLWSLVLIMASTLYYRQPHRKFIKDQASITVYYVGDQPIYSAEFMIVTEFDSGKLIVELITGPGEENVIRIEGDEAHFYLNGMGITQSGVAQR